MGQADDDYQRDVGGQPSVIPSYSILMPEVINQYINGTGVEK